MRLWKKIGLGGLVAFGVIQFIRPARNISGETQPTDITHVVPVPQSVVNLLQGACYDCHSNNTHYPWYMNAQPAAWFMARHVKKGKRDLNFSDFGSYSKRKQVNKLKSVVTQIEQGAMPLSSYALMHSAAKLTTAQKQALIRWARQSSNSLSEKE